MLTAAKTMEETLLFIDGERWCFFFVARAKTGVFAAALVQINLSPHEINKRSAVAQLVEKSIREAHSLNRRLSCSTA